MNEQVLRDEFEKKFVVENGKYIADFIDGKPVVAKQIFEWFLSKLHEREEEMVKKIKSMKISKKVIPIMVNGVFSGKPDPIIIRHNKTIDEVLSSLTPKEERP